MIGKDINNSYNIQLFIFTAYTFFWINFDVYTFIVLTEFLSSIFWHQVIWFFINLIRFFILVSACSWCSNQVSIYFKSLFHSLLIKVPIVSRFQSQNWFDTSSHHLIYLYIYIIYWLTNFKAKKTSLIVHRVLINAKGYYLKEVKCTMII